MVRPPKEQSTERPAYRQIADLAGLSDEFLEERRRKFVIELISLLLNLGVRIEIFMR